MKKEDWKDSSLWQEGQRLAKEQTKCCRRLFWVIILIAILSIVPASLWLNVNLTTASLGLGLLFNFVGALYLLARVIPTEETAHRMSTTRWDGNPDLLAAMLANTKVALLGLVFIALGFVLQFGSFLVTLL